VDLSVDYVVIEGKWIVENLTSAPSDRVSFLDTRKGVLRRT